jgi:hypothetical protein
MPPDAGDDPAIATFDVKATPPRMSRDIPSSRSTAPLSQSIDAFLKSLSCGLVSIVKNPVSFRIQAVHVIPLV